MIDSSRAKGENRLAVENSAYLRQHRHNPVDWYPWGDEAFERAQREDKPVLVSIGYSSCHWCHVMAHESFEDTEIAALMNRLLVNIKVDREERPDVDQIYMDTVVGLTGHGGWPLTVFCTPAGEPFWGGTYFPPEPRHNLPSFRQVLLGVDRLYRERRGEVQQNARRIRSQLQQRPAGVAEALPGRRQLAQAVEQLLAGADAEHGGFGGGPKFPTPTNLDLLLAAGGALGPEQSRRALDHVVFTCGEMARRGLFDHVGGGFHRYCVDAGWAIPHFEKMLYDQGQLIRSYAEAWRQAGDEASEELLWPIRETVEYLRREMSAPDGGFYASQDADSEGEEGRFYVWTPDQVNAVLGAEAAAPFREAYGITERGNFEGGTTHLNDLTRQPRAAYQADRATLYAARAKRVAPDTDPKRVASWNALAISGLARAGGLLADRSMLDDAIRTADFVLTRMVDADGRLLRVFNQGQARIPAFLDDHATLLEASLDLYRVGAGERFLEAAIALADQIATRFYDAEEGDLFLTAADGERLVIRPRSDHDGATPHSAGLAVLGLLRAATLTGRSDFQQIVDAVLRSYAHRLEQFPGHFPTLVRAAAANEAGLSTAVVIGDPLAPATQALADRARRVLPPEDAVLVAPPGGPRPARVDPGWFEGRDADVPEPTAYVCRGTTCSLPVTRPEQLQPLGAPPSDASS